MFLMSLFYNKMVNFFDKFIWWERQCSIDGDHEWQNNIKLWSFNYLVSDAPYVKVTGTAKKIRKT